MTKPRKEGGLVVSGGTASTMSGYAKITIRNDELAEVHSGPAGAEFALPEGLYSVEATAQSGEALSQLVRVEAGKTTQLALDEPASPQKRKRRRTSSADDRAEDAAPPAREVSLDGGEGWTSAQTVSGWIFSPTPPYSAVPSVLLSRGSARWEVSLPLNPEGFDENATCALETIDPAPVESVVPVVLRYPPSRATMGLISGQLERNTISSDTAVLDDAVSMLHSKMSDPTAAALGGLTLHRLGMLSERAEWVENLANGFPWLVDGRILLAALLRDDPDPADRARGLKLLLEASRERPMFADGLALALDLLNRWPDDVEQDARSTAAGALGPLIAYTNWSSVNLVTRVP
ncbi:hypothetical protein SAMN04487846_0779 [Microbacterium sp. cf046]|uniref:hypothetical protein n=1 Tax=Microbacterium sp. cf046 TaxID=1761803 RepID=UPI0008E614A4|nr:hypothetical protein [Microbacterium sp. cf046]SFR93288.1 hypothetical protein SAMN04487846_0779 [Microbacterium sp. cf046]